MKDNKVLVVGGTGFIGFHLIKKCLSLKMIVTSISRSKPSKLRKLKKVKYKVCNIVNFRKLKKLLINDYDFVVNLGGNIDHYSKNKTYNNHYIGVKNLYNIFQKKKIKRFIQIGSSSEYGKIFGAARENDICKPKMIYGRSKLLATNFLLKKNKLEKFPLTILRFFQIYGPHQSTNRLIPFVISSSLKDKSFNCSEGSQQRDFLYIDDAVDSKIKIFKRQESQGKIINIGYGTPIKIKKIILIINALIKKGKPKFGKLNLRIDESMKIYPNLLVAKKILRWKSKTSIKKGLVKTIQFYKRNSIKI